MAEWLESFGHFREIDPDGHRVTSVISTGNVARDDAVIESDGWRFENYDRNPVVLWQHNADGPPFARTIEHLTGDNELIARAEFDTEDAFGMSIFRKIRAGFINATSVRWLPLRFEWREEGKGKDKKQTLFFLEQELLEWSFVSIPADPGALIIRSGAALDLETFKKPAEPTGEVPDLTPKVEPARIVPAADYGAVADLLERFIMRSEHRVTPEDMTINALAKATGRMPDTIRRLMAERS